MVACDACGQAKSRAAFSKSQLRKAQPRCNECVSSPACTSSTTAAVARTRLPQHGTFGAPPVVVDPSGRHRFTLIALHGFTVSGRDFGDGFTARLRLNLDPALRAPLLESTRIVFLTAPRREITCYGGKPEWAWHDYYTDHGGAEGRPEIEEEIDEAHLLEMRSALHRAIDAEASALGGSHRHVAIHGESQGACAALDAALTHERLVGGVCSSFGQRYAATPVPRGERRALRIAAWHGAADRCIAASLAVASYAELLEAGYSHLELQVHPRLGHTERSADDAEIHFFARALQRWRDEADRGIPASTPAEPPATPTPPQGSFRLGDGGGGGGAAGDVGELVRRLDAQARVESSPSGPI